MFKNIYVFLIFLTIQHISYGMVDQKNIDECTHFMNAAEDGQVEIVSYLLSKKADANLKNIKGETALMIATAHMHSNIVEILLKKGADLYCQNSIGRTALSLIDDMIELFLSLGMETPDKLNEIIKIFQKYETELEVCKYLHIKDVSEIVVSYI